MAHLPSNTDMNIEDDIKRRSTSSSKAISRSISISSTASSCAYHLRMECKNNLLDEMEVEPIDSSHLSYINNVEREENSVSKITDPDSTRDL